MRTPIISLKKYVDEMNNTSFCHELFIAFQQEFMIRNYINECNEILEKYGVYDGQIKFCKELAEFIVENVNDNNDDNQDFFIDKEDLDTLYKGIFFKKLHIIANKDCITGYEASKSHLDTKTMLFDVVTIYINLNDYKSTQDMIVVLTHEVTHAYDNWNRSQKKNVDTLVDISNNKGYKEVVQTMMNAKNFEEKFCAEVIYTFTSIEKNAYLSELGVELEKDKVWTKSNVKSYLDALHLFQKSDAWKRFYVLKIGFEIMKDDEKKIFCDVYRRIKKVNWTDNKILKFVKDKIDKTFNKMLTNIPKLYYDFITKNVEEVKESKIDNINLVLGKRKYEKLKRICYY